MDNKNLRWSDISPEPGIVEALRHAGNRADKKDQHSKRNWSERFADGCALAIADQLRKSSTLRGKEITPVALGEKTERLTPLGATDRKRIDVTVTDTLLGLEIGVSLKGLNFRDGAGENFDKNMTGRFYELADENRLVHEHLPHAFMAGVVFLPLESVSDKKTAPSSFARVLLKLRSRSGRLDAALAGQAPKCDCGFVGLYTTGEEGGFPAGIVRFMDVRSNPPRRGRPRVADTLSLREAVERIVGEATNTIVDSEWSPSEED